MAKLAEQAERYDEMVEYMKRYASSNDCLTLEERNLLSVRRTSAMRLLGLLYTWLAAALLSGTGAG